jgi:PIN domain nuclease of toxin-antitoxin system
MNVLFDTSTNLWLQVEAARVPSSLRQALLSPETRHYSSAAAAWEIAIKWSSGKLVLPVPPAEFMRRPQRDSLVESLPINEASALQVAKLPKLHSDPFDRIQISQSIQHSLILATPDPLIRQYAVRTVWD